jgi:hypothetical protein
MEAWPYGCYQAGLPRLCFVQQLLWKGLFHASTCTETITAFTCLLHQVSSCLGARGTSMGITTFNPGMKAAVGGTAAPAVHGMNQLLGKCSQQIVASIVGGLPWVLLHRHDRKHHAQVCTLVNLTIFGGGLCQSSLNI